MDISTPELGCEGLEGFQTPMTTQALPYSFSQYLSPPTVEKIGTNTLHQVEQEGELGADTIYQTIPEDGDFTVAPFPNLRLTRQEIATLTSVLERIPESFITGEGFHSNQVLGLTVVDENMPPTMMTTSSPEDVTMPSSSRAEPHNSQQAGLASHGKHKRPKYSLTVSMLKKHPVLQFSATGLLDADKSPHKWWCRV